MKKMVDTRKKNNNYTTWNKGLTKETDIIEKIKMFIENE